MNAILRHMAVRLWLTFILGGLVSLAMLPYWQQPFGVDWLALPAAAILSVCFLAVGWGMSRLGRFFLERKIREAALWERAGQELRARAAYEQVASLFDSFWLSPRQRRRADRTAAGLLVRFHLSQPELSAQGRQMLAAYFLYNPQDAAAAEGWLEHLLEWESHTPEEHDATGKVADALTEHGAVQRRLMHFFLAAKRSDFVALRTYRRVWALMPDAAAVESIPLAKLLLSEALLNDWALQVYLAAHAAGSPEVLEGIAAAVRYLRPGDQNRSLLDQAKAVCAATGSECAAPSVKRFSASADQDRTAILLPGALSRAAKAPATVAAPPPKISKPIGPRERSETPWRFQAGEIDSEIHSEFKTEFGPDGEKEGESPPPSNPRFDRLKENLERLGRKASRIQPSLEKLKPGLQKLKPGPEHKKKLTALGRGAEDLGRKLLEAGAKSSASMAGKVREVAQKPRSATFTKVVFFSAAVVIGAAIAVGAWRYLTPPSATVSQPDRPVAPAVNDPFTIQVAAFVRPEEAKRFTERLKKQGLDAFIAVAGGGDRKWYQVKISHFATRAAAREFGEQLKAKGLIDDFYVANYAAGEILRSSP